MQMKWSKKLSSFILCMVLTAAIALTTFGCNGRQNDTASEGEKADVQAETQVQDQADDNVLGTGDTGFSLTVADQEGVEAEFEIRTDKETVGEALLELELIEGDESEYGLYVKTVNGITADYDEDGTYWAFYIGGEYAQTGVDSTPVTEGEEYSFKVEK